MLDDMIYIYIIYAPVPFRYEAGGRVVRFVVLQWGLVGRGGPEGVV